MISGKYKLINWEDTKKELKADHDNKGKHFGVKYYDARGDVAYIQWFKTEEERNSTLDYYTQNGVKYMSADELQGGGYLQEANRRFFHPLGLAMSVIIDDDDHMTFGPIWDHREDAEGMHYGLKDTNNLDRVQKFQKKAEKIENELWDKRPTRLKMFNGSVIEPVPGFDEALPELYTKRSTTAIAKVIANFAGMPYTWETVKESLEEGKALPYKLPKTDQF